MKIAAIACIYAIASAAVILPAHANPASLAECMELATRLNQFAESQPAVDAKHAEIVARCQAGDFAAAQQAYNEGVQAAATPSGNHE